MTTKDHIIVFLKGLLAVVITNACIAGLQYLGAHIPELLGYLGQVAAATGTIAKATKHF